MRLSQRTASLEAWNSARSLPLEMSNICSVQEPCATVAASAGCRRTAESMWHEVMFIATPNRHSAMYMTIVPMKQASERNVADASRSER